MARATVLGVDSPCRCGGDHLDQQFVAGLAAGVVQPEQLALLTLAQLDLVVGMVEDQALDHVVQRPFGQLGGHVGRALEFQRPRLAAARSDGRSSTDGRRPGPGRRSRSGRPAARRTAWSPSATASTALQRQGLEVPECARRRRRSRATMSSNWLRWSMARTVSSSWTPVAGGRPVHVLQLGVVAQAERPVALAQELLQLGPGRHGRRAAVARDDDRPAGVAQLAAGLDALVAQPAAQEAGHEGVARAQHVEHLDREARPPTPSSRLSGTAPGKADAAVGPRLQTSRASERSRMARRAAMVSVVPPRMWISSSVPTIRSQSGQHLLQACRSPPRGPRSGSRRRPCRSGPRAPDGSRCRTPRCRRPP